MPRLLNVNRIHRRTSGAEAVYLDHAALFRERGWDCAEFAMQDPRNEPSDWSRYFPSYFDPGDAKGAGKLTAAARFLHSAEARDKFAALLDDFRPHVIHMHGTYYQLTTSILGEAHKRDIPIVFTLHDYKLLCPAHHLFRPEHGLCEECKGGHQYRALVNRCLHDSYAVSAIYAADGMRQWWGGAVRKAVSTFIGPSRFLVNKYIEHGFAPDSLRYVPNFFETVASTAVPAERIAQLRAELGAFVLYFGRLSAEKGLSTLVAAAHAAGTPLVLAGSGPAEADLRRQAYELGADVVFTGHLVGAALWAHVEAARGVVLPSVWYENAPKSLLEAQSRRKLVIASAIGGLPEMVSDGETGFLVPPNDVKSLAGAIRRAIDLPAAEADRIGEAARQFVLRSFTRDRYFGEMSGIYDGLMVRRESVQAAVA